MDSDLFNYNHQQQSGSALTRYCSAPSSFFAGFLDDADDVDDFLTHRHHNHRPSRSSDSETMFANFVSLDGSGDPESRDPDEVNQSATAQRFSTSVKQEADDAASAAGSQLLYDVPPTSSAAAGVIRSAATENSLHTRPGGGNLIRHQSSPAGFYSGFAITKDGNSIQAASGANGKNPHYMSFSSGPSTGSTFVPRFIENGNRNTQSDRPENGDLNGNGKYQFSDSSLVDASCNNINYSSLKRNRYNDMKMVSDERFQPQSGYTKNYSTGLTHHLSLPTSASMEKYLKFQQDSVPCKIRAKRGCATHPRSIAERVRRTRISERIRKLQELFPSIDKQTSTADMLDMAVEYIKDLQKQVQDYKVTMAKCTCSGKQ